jgi:hypothetical protein
MPTWRADRHARLPMQCLDTSSPVGIDSPFIPPCLSCSSPSLPGDLNESFHPPRLLRQGGLMEDCFSALGLPIMPTHPARPSSPEEDSLVRLLGPIGAAFLAWLSTSKTSHGASLATLCGSASPEFPLSVPVPVSVSAWCAAGRVLGLDLRHASGPPLAGECDSALPAPHLSAAIGPLPRRRHVPTAALHTRPIKDEEQGRRRGRRRGGDGDRGCRLLTHRGSANQGSLQDERIGTRLSTMPTGEGNCAVRHTSGRALPAFGVLKDRPQDAKGGIRDVILVVVARDSQIPHNALPAA